MQVSMSKDDDGVDGQCMSENMRIMCDEDWAKVFDREICIGL